MSKKGNKTKQKIIDEASILFAKRGYSAITMKDICESSLLSRGGLYRHFSSTKEIFIAMLDRDFNENDRAVKEAIANNISAKIIFEYYLNHEKNAVFSEYNDCFLRYMISLSLKPISTLILING